MSRPEPRVFDEPWQAQSFAMVVALVERDVFTWSEWTEALSEQIKVDASAAYYENWLRALEALLAERQIAGASEVDHLAAAWERAAHATPHGRPIELTNDPQSRIRSA